MNNISHLQTLSSASHRIIFYVTYSVGNMLQHKQIRIDSTGSRFRQVHMCLVLVHIPERMHLIIHRKEKQLLYSRRQ